MYVNRDLFDRVKALLKEGKLPQQEIAQEFRISRSTVQEIDYNGDELERRLEKRAGKEIGGVIYRKLRKPKRCEEGHLTTVWPCMECTLSGQVQRNRRK